MWQKWLGKCFCVIFLMLFSATVLVACDSNGDNTDAGSVYAVSFDLAGGLGAIPEQAVEDGDYATLPSAPERPGYNFKGWYYGDKVWNFYSNRVYENTTLVAKWQKDESSWITSGNLKYEAVSGGYKLLGFVDEEEVDAEVVIPKMHTGQAGDGLVVEIASEAFMGKSEITMVSLGAGVKVIGERAFVGTGITEIVIPPSVEEIKSEAFCNLEGLESLVFGVNSNLKTIGEKAFYGVGVQTVSIPKSTTTINKEAFRASSVKNLLFSDNSSLFSIGEKAFYETKIEVMNLPDGLSEIFANAFGEIASLSRVVLPTSLTYMGRGVFYNANFEGVFVRGDSKDFKRNLFDEDWDETHASRFVAYFYSETDNGKAGRWYYHNGVPVLYVRNQLVQLDFSGSGLDIAGKKVVLLGYSVGTGKVSVSESLTLTEISAGVFSTYTNVYKYACFLVAVFDEDYEGSTTDVAGASLRSQQFSSVVNHIVVAGKEAGNSKILIIA